MENCSLPTDFYLGLFVAVTVLTVIFNVWILYAARGARGSLRQLRNYWVMISSAYWLGVLALFLEQGFFAGAAIAYMFAMWLTNVGLVWVCFEIFRNLFDIAPNFPAKKFEVRFKSAAVVWVFGICSPLLICAAIFVRDPTHERYNYIMGVFFTQIGVGATLNCSILASFFNRFIEEVLQIDKLKPSQGTTDETIATKAAMARLKAVATVLKYSGLGSLLFAAFGIAFFATNGNVPYMWIFYAMVITTPLQSFPIMLKGVRTAIKKQDQIEDNGKKEGTAVTTGDREKQGHIVSKTNTTVEAFDV
jgi:hypothetical protein